MKNLIIFFSLILIVSSSSCVGSSMRQSKAVVEDVDLKSATIIDVRTPEEFAEGHIKNSINIPVDVIEDSIEILKGYDSIVVVCRSGKRAEKAKKILESHGIVKVHNGMGWDSYEKTIIK